MSCCWGSIGKVRPGKLICYGSRTFPVETLSNGMTIPFLLAAVGFVLVDLSYLLGLFHLMRYRRAVRSGGSAARAPRHGLAVDSGRADIAAGADNTAQLFCGINYRPYELEGSGFVTLTDIEGEDFLISHNELFSMDHISHGGTLLDPESWYFRQYGAFGRNQNSDDVPHLELTITPLPPERWRSCGLRSTAARKSTALGTTQRWPATMDWMRSITPPGGTDPHQRGLRRDPCFPAGGIFILRLGSTVLCADYYGYQDLTKHLEQFSTMLKNL